MRGKFTTAALAGLALLAGCTSSGNPDPSPTPPPSSTIVASSLTRSSTAPPEQTSGSPKPSGPKTTGPGVKPGEKPPAMPALAKRHSREGALFFATYYYVALDWSLATEDPTLLMQLTTASCKTCQQDIASVRRLAAYPGHMAGGRLHINSSGFFQGKAGQNADQGIEVSVRQDGGSVVDGNGQSGSPHPAQTFTHLVLVDWTKSGWRVVGIEAPA